MKSFIQWLEEDFNFKTPVLAQQVKKRRVGPPAAQSKAFKAGGQSKIKQKLGLTKPQHHKPAPAQGNTGFQRQKPIPSISGLLNKGIKGAVQNVIKPHHPIEPKKPKKMKF